MAKKKYHVGFNYCRGMVEFEVDLDKFTIEHALSTLEFFSWNYDKDGDLIEEVVKKYALQVFLVGGGHSADGVIMFWNEEGFGPINGEIGILLTDYEQIEPSDDDIDLEVSDV